MTWPTPQDYNEAIQDPDYCFCDSELKSSKPELTALGLPRPYSGNFASVYRLTNTTRTWAVRCFLRQYDDQLYRYTCIEQSLSTCKLPYFVGFDYQINGIKVRGRYYPILKMEWVNGQLLNKYISVNLHNPKALSMLAQKWLEMIKALHNSGIAHGDLQHGNILLSENQIKLVDYDGMYVPSLSGKTSHEIGHINYQHPKRTADYYGPYLDTFSAWVIYLSIIALVSVPKLQTQFSLENDYILLKKGDFEHPSSSMILNTLLREKNTSIKYISGMFCSILTLDPKHMPELFEAAQQSEPKQPVVIKPTNLFPMQTIHDDSWIAESIFDPQPVDMKRFGSHLNLARWIITITFLFNTSVIIFIFLNINTEYLLYLSYNLFTSYNSIIYILSSIIAVLVEFTIIYSLFLTNNLVLDKKKHRGIYYSYQRKLRSIKHIAQNIIEDKINCQKKYCKDIKYVSNRIRLINNEEEVEIDRARAPLVPYTQRRNKLLQNLGNEIKTEQASFSRMCADIDRKINSLSQLEITEKTTALTSKQTIFFNDFLMQHKLINAHIPGVSTGRLQYLIASGIISANDITYSRVDRVYGFGPARTSAVVQWRRYIEQSGRQQMPQSLSQAEQSAISAKYTTQRKDLSNQRTIASNNLSNKLRDINKRYEDMLKILAKEIKDIEIIIEDIINKIKIKYMYNISVIEKDKIKITEIINKDITKCDDLLATQRRLMYRLNWDLASVDHTYTAFKNITFGHYLLALFGRK